MTPMVQCLLCGAPVCTPESLLDARPFMLHASRRGEDLMTCFRISSDNTLGLVDADPLDELWSPPSTPPPPEDTR